MCSQCGLNVVEVLNLDDVLLTFCGLNVVEVLNLDDVLL